MKKVEIKGIIPPIVTPMNEDESVNEKELRNQVNRQIKGGIPDFSHLAPMVRDTY